MQTIVTTILHRPYVFAFLISFLVIGFLNRGAGRTFLFLFLGYSIAFLSEFSSIRNGFPYGMYHYVYENMPGELMLGGVPVWDSLSYAFMAYAAYEYAEWITARRSPLEAVAELERPTASCPVLAATQILIPACLMLLLDVVADPLAVRGEKWFLGRIFYYPDGGTYFGVPLSNFAGWLLVAAMIFLSYRWLEKGLFKKPPPRRLPIAGLLFYWVIVAFNLAITFWIGEIAIGLTGLALHAATTTILIRTRSH